MKREPEIKNQAGFCKILMAKLWERVDQMDYIDWWGNGHTSIQSDIIQLRRELMELSKMLTPD